MAFSVNTNSGAMAALQSLNATNKSMETTQSRITTGLNVASTKDDSAKYTVAQTLRGDLGKLGAVTTSLNNAKSVTDVAVAGAEQISDLVNQMKSKALEASDAGLDDESRKAISNDLLTLKKQINTVIEGSSFNGTNLLKGTAAVAETTPGAGDGVDATGGKVSALQSIDGDTLSVNNQGLSAAAETAFGDADTDDDITNIGLANDPDDVAGTGSGAADALLTKLDTMFDTVKTSLSDLGAGSRQIEGQLSFNSNLSDVITTGIGSLVDADLAKESANLQALQVQQQLGVQALSIANQSPQTLLSLFR
ncbi:MULTISPECIES: flagellin [Novosphingobium]|jgi:flagellin|uniref:Flagellin n=1 Tax=Novosphingobium resinovorum TaxID=158500 RepID=A0A031JTC1_9SPHN|nr:flagellin [Novosphingobium resinovorum]EZP80139.1 Flagellin domain-containing protein [Novosphingobium resinovorum]GLK44101.1 flagellin [Novosphingobium resinovorum]